MFLRNVYNTFFVKAYQFSDNQEEMLRFYWSLQPDGWWIGLKDGVPCAFGGAVDYQTFCSIGMVAVDPVVQGQGIGTALVQHILDWCERRSIPTMLLEADFKAVSLYKRLGFIAAEGETARSLKLVKRTKKSETSSDIELMQEKDIEDVSSFDAFYFGARRQKIMASTFAITKERAFLVRNSSGKISGFIFAESYWLGPWVAETIEDAEKLLKHVLTLPFTSGPSLSLPSSNKAGVEMLKQYGFRERAPSQHMRRGKEVSSMQRSLIFGQASMALG